MKAYKITENQQFIGREFEQKKLREIANSGKSSIVIVHGRRRVGKTELIEQTLGKRGLLKFEGRENQPEEVQRQIFLETLADYCQDSSLSRLTAGSWRVILQILAEKTTKGEWTIFLEEFQWMCCYESDLISELKYIWDNSLRHNPKLILVLCGSSPSFMLREVVYSKALYNRSTNEIALKPFTLTKSKEYLGQRFSHQDALTAHLAIGGIPEYLEYIRKSGSTIPGLVNNSFLPEAFFCNEKKRVFVSALADNPHYESIIDHLAQLKYATRGDLLAKIGILSGGSISKIIEDLETCGFINSYTPFDVKENSTNIRYEISDNYLQFYFRFIKPKLKAIAKGRYQKDPAYALNLGDFEQWLGFAFERFCRHESNRIAKILEFSGVDYRSGALFRRGSKNSIDSNRGFQIDLVFERADRVYTLCELKHTSRPIDVKLAREIVQKFDLAPLKKTYSRQRVLISINGATQEVRQGGFFDRIIELKDLY